MGRLLGSSFDSDKTEQSPCHGASVLMSKDRKSTRLNSSHGYISYAVFCLDQKSTRLNSSHGYISYAVFCLKKKNVHPHRTTTYRDRPVLSSPTALDALTPRASPPTLVLSW